MAQFQSTVTIATDYSLLGASSEFELVELLENTAKKITLGVTDRTSIFIQNTSNNAVDVYLGLDDNTDNTRYFASLTAGEKIQFIVSKSSPVELWAWASEDCFIAVLEGSEV